MFIRACILVAGFEVLAAYATLAIAQVDPTKVLIGRWEGRIEGNKRGSNQPTLVIRSVEPTETGWVAERRVQGAYHKDVEVSIKDGLIVLEYKSSQHDPYRLVLTGDNRLEGALYYAQYKGSGIRMHTYRVSFEKTQSKR